MNTKSFKGGPGYWKFNSSLLSEANFVADVIINTDLSEYQNNNLEIKREMSKAKFKFFCIELEYTHNQSKNREYWKHKLWQELNKSDHKLATEPQNGQLKRDLQEIKQAQVAQVQSRAKWIKDKEKRKNTPSG